TSASPARTRPRRRTPGRGVRGRLDTYRLAKFTDDFPLAVAFRFVVPHLSAEQLSGFGTGELRVADLRGSVRDWIRDHVAFTAVLCPGPAALAAERAARRVGLDDT